MRFPRFFAIAAVLVLLSLTPAVTRAQWAETFDSGNTPGADPVGWTVSKPAGTEISVVDSSVNDPYSWPYSVKIADNSTTTFPGMWRAFSPVAQGNIVFRARLPSTMNAPFRMELREPSGAYLMAVIFLPDGTMAYQGSGAQTATTLHWSVGAWCNVQVDWTPARQFSASLNGYSFAAGVPLAGTNSPGQVWFGGTASTSSTLAYLDQITVTPLVSEFADSFDVGNTVGAAPSNWFRVAPAGTTAQVVNSTTTDPYSWPNSVQLTDQNTSSDVQIYRDFAPLPQGTASCKFKIGSLASAPMSLQLKAPTGALLVAILFQPSGKMAYDTGAGAVDTTFPWSAGAWNTVQVDWDASGIFTARLNGNVFASNLSFGWPLNPGRVVLSAGTAAGSGASGFVDNVVLTGSVDAFGIRMLSPTINNGRQWFANWTNGVPRTVYSGDRDPYDNQFIARGDGQVVVDGAGTANLSGDAPRMYVYDAAKTNKWKNVEVTFYGRRVGETAVLSYQGFVAGTRSDHQDASDAMPCPGRTYYGRLLYDGRIVFQKEIVHHGAYSTNVPSEVNYGVWTGPKSADGTHNTMQTNQWIGYKLLVRSTNNNQWVNLQLYRDMTDGANGGTWEKQIEYTDKGGWQQADAYNNPCGVPNDLILTNSGTCTFIRNDGISRADYKKFSVREIPPLP